MGFCSRIYGLSGQLILLAVVSAIACTGGGGSNGAGAAAGATMSAGASCTDGSATTHPRNVTPGRHTRSDYSRAGLKAPKTRTAT